MASQLSFSPRPWGCTDHTHPEEGAGNILPTPVGLYLKSPVREVTSPDSPHARGAVPGDGHDRKGLV